MRNGKPMPRTQRVTPRSAARNPAVVPALLRAAHLGPTLAVTTIAALLALTFGLPAQRAVVVTLAVFAGQLTIGWGNDLLDLHRDRGAARADKPLVTGQLAPSLVRRAMLGAAAVCVALSLLVGWRSAMTHLLLAVGSAHLYNLGLKATSWSWLPYAVAFGASPAVVSLADSPPQWPPLWIVGAAAALGVAAHFLNTLLDLEDDAATGVRGLPHRLGARWSRIIATTLLVVASAVVILAPSGAPAMWNAMAFAVVAALAILALLGTGKAPFYAAVTIAVVNIALLAAVVA